MNLYQKFGWVISVLATALASIWIAQTNHIKDEVSREEVNAIVDARTQKLSDEMGAILEHSERTDSTMLVVSEQLKHFRVKATWYYGEAK